jgi:hypothetical protein
VRKEEEKERVGFAHHTESLRKRPRARKEQRRVISDGGGSGGAPADGVGAPGGVEDVNLQQEKLSKHQMQHQRERKGEKEESFTGDEFFTDGNGGTKAATRASVAALVG